MRNIRFRLLVFCALVVGMFLVAASLSWAQGQSQTVVRKATKHASSPPLSQLVPIPPPSGDLSSVSDDDRLVMYRSRSTSPAQDSVLQGSPQTTLNSAALSPLSTNSGLNILGIGYGFPGYSLQAVVPDANVAVGPTQVVQFVDRSFAVFNKSDGTVAYGPASGNTLWQALGAPCSAQTNSDEIVQF